MTSIGNALFGRIAMESFNRLSGDISDLQARISSGKNDPRPSVDPMRAAKLSAVTEQRGAIDRFTENTSLAADRLSHADLAMTEVQKIATSYQQIALRAASDTLTEEGIAGLRAEALSLRTALLSAANSRDTMGLPLFAGFGSEQPFTDGPNGVTYNGDGGRPTLRLNETSTLATGLNGAEVFGSVPSEGESRNMFDMVDDLIATLSLPLQPSRPFHSVKESALFTPVAGRDPSTLSFTLTGPAGKATISAELVKGAPGPLLDAVNAQSIVTGITATLAPDGESLILASKGTIRIGDLAGSATDRKPLATLAPADANGEVRGTIQMLRDTRLSADRMVGAFNDAISHIASQHAEVGSLAALADSHAEVLSARRLRIDQAVAGLEDLDVAAAITKLQGLLLTEQAAQQSFVKINGTSLFDYLR
ncbi:flagellar hook-associated protein FlgL [Paragemmobacter straminiformis]|uniref:Flagellar hook-associated protein FlgL n=1 Tax=Paragemmobacter straminiformis TaxID=2045119 RepID=A0A842I571_9RHOB|nr:flagellar hook-associated protein FlgL [Gemmobacter straminiformis]MBC2834759.1 flagellar hook-associated protein FlgL [Gemmobacter straminiformis]